MILNLYMENQGRKRQNKWWFTLNDSNEIVARAVNGANICTTLWYGKNKYQFKNIPKIVEKVVLDFKYPYSSKRKKTIGFNVLENAVPIAEFHWDALRCRESGVNKNIGLNVFKYDKSEYLLFHVGLPKHKSSYYCLYENGGETVAVIARHHTYKDTDNCKATLYIGNAENLLITLFACTAKIIDVVNYWDKGENVDLSAGPVISNLVEERELYDANFVEQVQKQGNWDTNICSLEIPKEDINLATEKLDWKTEEKQKEKADLKIRRMFFLGIIVCIFIVILKLFGIELIF